MFRMQVFLLGLAFNSAKMSSIYRKLVISFLVLNMFAIGAIGIYSYYKEKEALLSRTFDQLISVRKGKKDRIFAFFKQRLTDMRNITQLPGLDSLFTLSHYSTEAAGQTHSLFHYLSSWLKHAGCYRNLLIVPARSAAFSLSPSLEGNVPVFLSPEEQMRWKQVIPEGDTLRQPMIREVFTGSPVIIVQQNIIDGKGHMKATVILEVKQEAVNAIMFDNSPRNGLGKTGEVYLVGSDGLMRSNSRFFKDATYRTRVSTPGVIRALHGKTGFSQFPDYRHIPVLSAYSPLHFSGIKWAILAEIDTKEAMVPIYSIRDNIIYLSLLLALLSAAIITFLSKKITDPLKNLKAATAKIASGKYGHTIPVKTKDELGELTRAFNEMSEKLKSQAETLESEKKLRLRSVLDAQEEERQRLSRELHDGLGPLLLTGKMKLEAALESDKNGMTTAVKEVMGLFAETVQEIRNISNNMMPSGLKEFGLKVAVEDLCRQIQENNGLKIHCHIALEKAHYGKTVAIYLFRIAQEALNNVLKHAQATEIFLNLEEIDGHLYFTLSDNGRGFDPSRNERPRGNGLINLKERVNLLNGFFELTTAPGKGTRIDIDIPVL